MDNSKRIRKMQNKEVCNLFFAFKKLITELRDFFFFFFYLCHLWPIRLFSQDILAFLLWETSGWVSMKEPRINKIPADAGAQWEDSPWPHKQRHTPFPTLSGPSEGLERICQSWWTKSLGTLPVCGPSGLCLPEDALCTVGNDSIVFWSLAYLVWFQIPHWIQTYHLPSGVDLMSSFWACFLFCNRSNNAYLIKLVRINKIFTQY